MKELEGILKIQADRERLLAFCKRHIGSFDPQRFEVVALRLYSGENEYVLTIYAEDRHNKDSHTNGKLPVKKFKLGDVPPLEILDLALSFNFTVSDGKYALEEMEVVNK